MKSIINMNDLTRDATAEVGDKKERRVPDFGGIRIPLERRFFSGMF